MGKHLGASAPNHFVQPSAAFLIADFPWSVRLTECPGFTASVRDARRLAAKHRHYWQQLVRAQCWSTEYGDDQEPLIDDKPIKRSSVDRARQHAEQGGGVLGDPYRGKRKIDCPDTLTPLEGDSIEHHIVNAAARIHFVELSLETEGFDLLEIQPTTSALAQHEYEHLRAMGAPHQYSDLALQYLAQRLTLKNRGGGRGKHIARYSRKGLLRRLQRDPGQLWRDFDATISITTAERDPALTRLQRHVREIFLEAQAKQGATRVEPPTENSRESASMRVPKYRGDQLTAWERWEARSIWRDVQRIGTPLNSYSIQQGPVHRIGFDGFLRRKFGGFLKGDENESSQSSHARQDPESRHRRKDEEVHLSDRRPRSCEDDGPVALDDYKDRRDVASEREFSLRGRSKAANASI